jgi:hypothetical protein
MAQKVVKSQTSLTQKKNAVKAAVKDKKKQAASAQTLSE